MDALAGYGSDDSSSSASQQQQQEALSGLLNYSDNDDSSENEMKQMGSKLSNEKGSQKHSINSSSGGADRKRKRSWDNNAVAASTDDVLPPPPTSTDKSLIEWENDYTASYRAPPASVIQNPQLTRKLSALESGKESSISWAQHLKSQHEFHNPHFFDNVVTHFGIQHPLQSNVPSQEFQLYEFDLPAAEEQARIRKEQELQEQHERQQQQMSSHVVHAHRYGGDLQGRPRGMSM
jgi:hypothetical protein